MLMRFSLEPVAVPPFQEGGLAIRHVIVAGERECPQISPNNNILLEFEAERHYPNKLIESPAQRRERTVCLQINERFPY